MLSDLSADERIIFVAEQILAVQEGRGDYLTCPYCGVMNKIGEDLCCDLFKSAAVQALASACALPACALP